MTTAWMEEVKKALSLNSIEFTPTEEPEGGLSLNTKDENCIVEIHPDGSLVCLFGSDLDELRGMISGGATEDLSSDELQRVARDNLRQTIGPRAMILRRSGYEEEIQAAEEYYILGYRKILKDSDADQIVETVRHCLNVVEGRNNPA